MKKSMRKLWCRKSGKNSSSGEVLSCSKRPRLLPLPVFLFLFWGVLFFVPSANAQTDKGYNIVEAYKLNAKQLEDCKLATEKKVAEFQNCIIIISSKTESVEMQNKATKSALKLFIPDAHIQVSNVNTNLIKNYSLEEYLGRLCGLYYTKVEVSFYDIAFVDDFKRMVILKLN